MNFLTFIRYCLKCMIAFFPAAFGYRNDLSWKDGFVGFTTLIVIALLIFLIIFVIFIILRSTGVIKKK